MGRSSTDQFTTMLLLHRSAADMLQLDLHACTCSQADLKVYAKRRSISQCQRATAPWELHAMFGSLGRVLTNERNNIEDNC
jgi:hypothetical protein